jgi:hypothetical protein
MLVLRTKGEEIDKVGRMEKESQDKAHRKSPISPIIMERTWKGSRLVVIFIQ